MVKSKGIVFHINKKVFDYDKFAEYLNEKSEKITEVLNNDEKNLPFHFTKVFSEVYQLDQDEDYKHVYLVKKRVSSLVPSIEDTVAELYNKELRFNEQDIEGDYPLVVFDESGKMNDEGEYPIDKEATKAIRNKLEADKKEWFPTLYQKSEHLNSDEENIVWQPSSKEVADEPSEKLTEKEKCLLSSMFEYLQTIGFVDVDGEEEDGLDEEELEARTTQRIQTIKDKILGKDYSSND